MNPMIAAFLVLAGLTCASALAMAWTKNLLHAALAMFLCMLGLAGLYVMAYADVMAVAHLLIYVGGVLILILFGIMLTQNSRADQYETHNDLWTKQSGRFWALSISLSVFLGILFILNRSMSSFGMVSNEIQRSTKLTHVGLALLTEYSFAFELAGVFLLIALVGATYIAKHHE
ncbi:NADH-quinone oxidoreductase subunit J [Aquirufa aurantiipilula]|uniref:NADH-quinone oxidoreductase subunit J n=1 Tax=Aquirufa aurantiipilula TaxID=2696561 RepID=A0ABT6BJ53_9BACT|nr:NADH-quinone oxidoreductase subunit J [Aquirufa aurantiipilula]MBZ1325990.1 NADH-quinone oxidoreductase subunit J [Aquirufa aurantiipilula]MDF5690497.1 NADH-quinone oxidoreductase subunit J [Aquirufa aurantiipilula]